MGVFGILGPPKRRYNGERMGSWEAILLGIMQFMRNEDEEKRKKDEEKRKQAEERGKRMRKEETGGGKRKRDWDLTRPGPRPGLEHFMIRW